jgi:hypothetical protein
MTLPQPSELEELVKAAFRSTWGAVAKASTGAVVTIAAHADGSYTRSSGSFLDDGFDPSDEIGVIGFPTAANNGSRVIESVTATEIRTNGTGMVDEAEGSAVTIAMGLPSRQKLAGMLFTPDPVYPWLSETFSPDMLRAASIAVRNGQPLQRLSGIYWLTVNYPMGAGSSGLSRLRGKFIQSIYAGRSLVYLGHTIRIRAASPKTIIEKGQFTSGAVAWTFQADALNP